MHRRQKFSPGPKMKADMSGHSEVKGDIPDTILRQARKCGQLNLSNRELTTVPDKVWTINVDVPEEGKSASLEKEDDRWWEQTDLNKLILASNKLTSISSDIKQLPALVVLDKKTAKLYALLKYIGRTAQSNILNRGYCQVLFMSELLIFLPLHDNEITSLPEAIGDLLNLKRLNLSYNRFTSLPFEIGNLTALGSLLLQHNQLKTIVESVGQLKKLEELDISNNLLEVLPSSLGSMKCLRKLNISNNSLTNCPTQLGDMSVLSELNLSNNKIKELPATIGNLEKLERFDCRYNQLSRVPMLKSCKMLKELYLGYGQIPSIDAHEISCLSSVVVLDIRDNKISHLPKEITTMECLERLDLSNNNLSGLPYEMGNMTELKSVILEGNPLRSIRRDIVMKGTVALLKHLKNKIPADEEKKEEAGNPVESSSVNTHLLSANKTLSYSQQKAAIVPDEVWASASGTPVTSIDFSKNLLEEIPLRLCNFETTLTSVNLGSNKISKIPPEFCLLSHLTHLDLRDTPGYVIDLRLEDVLSKVTAGQVVRGWSNAMFLDTLSNHLSTIPDEFKLLSELREIILSHNRFTSLPDILYSLSKLEVILASNNQIAAINVEGILKLKVLSSLDLSNNSISSVPPELGRANTLRSLQLEGNLFRNPRLTVLKKGTAALLEYLIDRIPT